MVLDAVVVGSGPNGLTAAVLLAQAGASVTVLEQHHTIGGGTRTAQLTADGLLHDICSAIHPFAAASPVLRTLPLERFGLRWRHAPVVLAHPLPDGTAAALYRSLDQTADHLGADGQRWKTAFAPLVSRFDDITESVLGPLLRWPRHPVSMGLLGLRALPPARLAANLFRGELARALFMGCSAHAYRSLNAIASSAVGVMHVAAAHSGGWPVAEGGSAAITEALAALLRTLGGTITVDAPITDLAQLPPARTILFDTSPSAFASIAGGRQPRRHAQAYRRYRHGPAAFKLDLAVRGGIPWTAPQARQAAAVHVGGYSNDIVEAEAAINRGHLPARPFTLVGQQYLADPSRSRGDLHPVWIYAHVPQSYPADVSDQILSTIESYAPGFIARIEAIHTTSPLGFSQYNPNYVGGDILTGANSLLQTISRPVLSPHSYSTGIPGMFLCSAATPPGAGTHGMCGYYAARAALGFLGLR